MKDQFLAHCTSSLLCRKLSPFPLDRTVVCWQLVGHLITMNLQLFINSLSLPRWVHCMHLQRSKRESLTCCQCYVLLPIPCCCRTTATRKYPPTSSSLSTSMTLTIFLQNLPCSVITRHFERMTPLWETQPTWHQLAHAHMYNNSLHIRVVRTTGISMYVRTYEQISIWLFSSHVDDIKIDFTLQ